MTWWILATPLYVVIGTARHEASHALAAIALGGTLIDWSILPSNGQMGYVEVEGGNPEWVWVAAPYFCDVLTFGIGYAVLRGKRAMPRWLFWNVLVVMLISPLVNSAYNYRGVFGSNDVGYLAEQLDRP